MEAHLDKCAACHGPDLQGAMARSLIDSAFRSSYKGKPMRALYSKNISTMPQGEPGTLNEAQVLALTALIGSRNGLPVGAEKVGAASDLSNRTFPNMVAWK